jgi:hypothetical protein
MNSNLKNIATVLVLFTIAVGGYYMFIKKDATELNLGGSATGDLFFDVQKYIDRRELLSNVKLDTALFNDQRFRSLVYFSTEGAPLEVGRTNPFDDLYEIDSE